MREAHGSVWICHCVHFWWDGIVSIQWSLPLPLPLPLGDLTPLLKLDLSNNQLEGNLPTINNGFSHGLTKSLQEMYYWEEMVLSNNPIGRALEGLEWHGLQNLVVLDLFSMGLTCEIPKFI
ncbi:hypothetical protein Peur_018047 [Populus x canadensis]